MWCETVTLFFKTIRADLLGLSTSTHDKCSVCQTEYTHMPDTRSAWCCGRPCAPVNGCLKACCKRLLA